MLCINHWIELRLLASALWDTVYLNMGYSSFCILLIKITSLCKNSCPIVSQGWGRPHMPIHIHNEMLTGPLTHSGKLFKCSSNKTILKCVCEYKRLQIAMAIVIKKNKVRSIVLSSSWLHYKGIAWVIFCCVIKYLTRSYLMNGGFTLAFSFGRCFTSWRERCDYRSRRPLVTTHCS